MCCLRVSRTRTSWRQQIPQATLHFVKLVVSFAAKRQCVWSSSWFRLDEILAFLLVDVLFPMISQVMSVINPPPGKCQPPPLEVSTSSDLSSLRSVTPPLTYRHSQLTDLSPRRLQSLPAAARQGMTSPKRKIISFFCCQVFL